MRLTPRLQLIAPAQVRLLGNTSVGLDDFKKGDIVTIEKHHADLEVKAKRAEHVAESEGLESVNRFEVIEAKTSKKQEKLEDALNAISDEDKAAEAKPIGEEGETKAVGDNPTNSNTQRVTRTAPKA